MGAQRQNNGLVPWLAWAALVLVLDQTTKLWVIQAFELHQGQGVTSFFNLVRVHNEGAAFSFLANSGGWQRWFFTGLGLMASIVIVWMLRAHGKQKLFAFALASILGGALGNVIDRIAYGHVVDFLDFYYGAWHFPAFNLADSAITLGAICLILDELRRVCRQR